MEGVLIQCGHGQSHGLGSFALPFHLPAHPGSLDRLLFGPLFRRFVVDPEIALRLARPQGERLPPVGSRVHIQPPNDPALPEVRDTVAFGHSLIDPVDIDHADAIIERDIDPAEVPLLIEHPRRQLMKLLEGPMANEFLGEIDMDFARVAFRRWDNDRVQSPSFGLASDFSSHVDPALDGDSSTVKLGSV